ncbi:DUF551 domain-containing protein [Acinetobacter nosocomialis]|uniref:DUF551 domain-containing protein n=1 Tax=Acinetobacter nosocomialis TaxID=106654 RepID=UPI001D0ECF6D|nr:DUF551 domain-containing protein [Acinetobacter nosocomialis]
MTDLNKLKNEFEAWVLQESPQMEWELNLKTDGEYDSAALSWGWAAWQEKAKAQAVTEWISVDDRMPESLRNVLVLIDANSVKNQNQMVAHFIPKFTEEYHGDDDWYDYDEDRGCGYVKEGWYANTAYIGDEYSSYFIEEKVTHWKPLKEASESGAEG